MRIKLLFIIGLIFPVFSFGQNWEALGGGSQLQEIRGMYVDTTENLLYAVGQFQEIGGIPADRVAKWNGVHWISLCDTGGYLDSNPIIEVLKYNGQLIITGQQWDMDGEFCQQTAYLDDTIWKPYGEPNSLAFLNQSDSDLFMLGAYTELDGQLIKHAAKKTATGWEEIGDPNVWTQASGFTYEAVNYQNKIVIGGNFSVPGFKEIIQWDGAEWQALGDGVVGEAGISFLKEFQGILYVGGYFEKFPGGNPASNVMAWDGEKWFDPFPEITFNHILRDMQIIDDEIYFVTSFYFNSDPLNNYTFAKFDGEQFCAFGGTFTTANFQDPQQIAKYNDTIIVACNKTLFGDTVNYIAKWLGNQMDTCISSPVHLDITEQLWEQSISIYPNPSSSHFEVSSGDANLKSIYLYSQNGKLVLQDKLFTPKKKHLIQTNSFDNGFYFVEIETDRGVMRKKIQIIY